MDWPALPLDDWRDTYATLHRCLQMVGKVQLALTPRTNHYWNVALRPTARGLTTHAMPHADGYLEIEADFVDHALLVRTSAGATRALAFLPRSVADFHREFLALLRALGVRARIWDHPVELQEEAIPFPEDRVHAAYDERAVERWWRIVAASSAVLEDFRAEFVGKCSPVHFFWGSFDLAVSRFSGRRAPVAEGADPITREAYSHEVSSVGFWPGDVRYPFPAYYAYTVPAPLGIADATVRPAGAAWHPGLGEFLLPYDAVRSSAEPRAALLEFCRSTYVAGAELGGWEREALERSELPPPPVSPSLGEPHQPRL